MTKIVSGLRQKNAISESFVSFCRSRDKKSLFETCFFSQGAQLVWASTKMCYLPGIQCHLRDFCIKTSKPRQVGQGCREPCSGFGKKVPSPRVFYYFVEAQTGQLFGLRQNSTKLSEMAFFCRSPDKIRFEGAIQKFL